LSANDPGESDVPDRLTPALLMRLWATGAVASLVVLAVASPDLFNAVVRGGEPMELVSRDRLNFLRMVLAPLVAAAFGFSLWHRNAVNYRPLQQLLFALPLAAVVVVVLYKGAFGTRDPRYLWFVREDGPVEYATALVFLIGSLTACLAVTWARDLQTRLFLELFAFGMLFIALSEVSFGQRVLGLETPDGLASINRQQEISLHNVRSVEFVVYRIMPLVILAYAMFSRRLAGRIGRGGIGRHVSRDLLAVAPIPWFAATYFLPMALYCLNRWMVEDAVFKDQEPSELFLAIGFFLVAWQARSVLASVEGRDDSAAERKRVPLTRPRRS